MLADTSTGVGAAQVDLETSQQLSIGDRVGDSENLPINQLFDQNNQIKVLLEGQW